MLEVCNSQFLKLLEIFYKLSNKTDFKETSGYVKGKKCIKRVWLVSTSAQRFNSFFKHVVKASKTLPNIHPVFCRSGKFSKFSSRFLRILEKVQYQRCYYTYWRVTREKTLVLTSQALEGVGSLKKLNYSYLRKVFICGTNYKLLLKFQLK